MKFRPGRNIAMKVPSHEYARTVAFYREILGLEQLGEAQSATESVRFAFGDKMLWIDNVPAMTQLDFQHVERHPPRHDGDLTCESL